MSENMHKEQTLATTEPTTADAAPTPAESLAMTAAAGGELDSIDNLDFLLEEIENKIAPLALA